MFFCLQFTVAFAEIDWYDYAIVQTIEFTSADANSELPPPMSVQEVENMTLAQKRMAAMIMENTAEDVEAHRAKQAAAEAEAAKAVGNAGPGGASNGDEDDVVMEESDDEDEDIRKKQEDEEKVREFARAQAVQNPYNPAGPVKIRTDYVPKRKYFISSIMLSPLTNKSSTKWAQKMQRARSQLAIFADNKFPMMNYRNIFVLNCLILAGRNDETLWRLEKHSLQSCSVVPMSPYHSETLHGLVWIYSKVMRMQERERRQPKRKGARKGRKLSGMVTPHRKQTRSTNSLRMSISTNKLRPSIVLKVLDRKCSCKDSQV